MTLTGARDRIQAKVRAQFARALAERGWLSALLHDPRPQVRAKVLEQFLRSEFIRSGEAIRQILREADDPMRMRLVDEIVKSEKTMELMLRDYAASLTRYSPELVRLLRSAESNLQEVYSQEGEDIILARIFGQKADGFYVDVGAHHPIRFSNTYLLHLRGWRGINIDSTPGSMEPFKRLRPGDINLELFVSVDTSPKTLHLLSEPALNTGSAELAAQRGRENPGYCTVGTAIVESRTLAAVLNEYLGPGRAIDVLNVDVEGTDLDVLRSNDWTQYRPTVILAEVIGTTLAGLEQHELTVFLRRHGYGPAHKLVNTVIFYRQD